MISVKQKKYSIFGCAIIALTFLFISYFATYNTILLPSLVIGDNFYWSKSNIVDILGLKVVRESYMGDIALLSTFRNGFLFPFSYILTLLKLPISIVYPFLFYFLSMLSFYALSMEFLNSKIMRIVVSAMYLVNPVVPYYFASLLSAFALVFLPLAFKYFIRALREIDQPSGPSCLSKNFVLCALFLSLCLSAHEQLFLTVLLITLYIISAFIITSLRKLGLTRNFLRFLGPRILLFASVFLAISTPLILSLNNIGSSPLAEYYTGRFDDFLTNVRFSYTTANPITLFRLGGDSGGGLETEAWYDSTLYTNVFGYTIFIAFMIAIFLLVIKTDYNSMDRTFFFVNVIMFANAFVLIMFMKNLPSNRTFATSIFSFLLQTWESPGKLRVILLLCGLSGGLLAFRELEKINFIGKKRIIKSTMIVLVVLSTVIYNSPWLIGYAGSTPLQQISDYLGWGELFDAEYSSVAEQLQLKYYDKRGLIIPYTHKAELYVPSNFRLFQLVSPIND